MSDVTYNKGASCDKCTNCALVDNGWSNWTVDGTDVHCMSKKHPCDEFDLWYGKDDRLHFAIFCPSYREGDPVKFYVEMDPSDFEGMRDGDIYWFREHFGVPYGCQEFFEQRLADLA